MISFAYAYLGNAFIEKYGLKRKAFMLIPVLIFFGIFLVFVERFWMEHYLTYKPALSLYVGTIIMAMACFAGAIYLPEMRYLKFFAYVGKNLSLYIYVIHMLIYEIMVKKFGDVHIVLVAIVVTLAAFVIHKILDIRLRKCS